MVLTRDQIIAVRDLKTKVVYPPGDEWKGGVRIQEMNALTMERYVDMHMAIERSMKEKQSIEGLSEARAKIAAMCIIDEKGERLFSDDEWGVIAAKRHEALKVIIDEIGKLSGVQDDDEDEQGDKEPSFEAIRGELPSDPSESSIST